MLSYYQAIFFHCSSYKLDDRSLFLYVKENSDDFQFFFSSSYHRQRSVSYVKQNFSQKRNRSMRFFEYIASLKHFPLFEPIDSWTCYEKITLTNITYVKLHSLMQLDAQVFTIKPNVIQNDPVKRGLVKSCAHSLIHITLLSTVKEYL